jgi:two-component system sensor histidine kinase HydH
MRERVVPFDSLPTAALLIRDGQVVAVNKAYERFMGVPAHRIVGRAVLDLVAEFVRDPDVPLAGAAAQALRTREGEAGQLWMHVTDATGRPKSVRVDWAPAHSTGETPDDGGESVVYLVDAEAEAYARATAVGLARAAGELGRCRDEREILERAADVLHARGMRVTTLLLREGDSLLEYGPTRSLLGHEEANVPPRCVRLRRELLWELNADFHQRRAAFFQDFGPLIEAAYPGEIGERIRALVPERRTVQAPLFVDDVAYGALVLTSDELTPALAGSLEMFAELVARAIENVRLRTELVQSERLAALGEAAAVMAHEVRNPIAALLNAAALLRKKEAPRGERAALLGVIGEEAHRLDRLVSDLLDLGRPLTPRARPVDLYDLAQRSVAVLVGRGELDAAQVEVARPAGRVLAEIDPDLTQLALWNVVRNAVQATPPGKRVTVAAAERDERAALVVDDEGPGFPAEHVERLLEPFHTTRATGTGIGLAVVRRVVDASRGTIEIGSSPSRGGRFVMVFPRAL